MAPRTSTLQGVSAQPKHDSESPKSGIRLQPPSRVPRISAGRLSLPRPSRLPPTPTLAPAPAQAPPVLRVVRSEDAAPAEAAPAEAALLDTDFSFAATEVTIPAPPPSRKAAVRPRAPRMPGLVAADSVRGAEIPGTKPADKPGDIPAPKPSPIQFRSMVTTADNWPLVRPPVPASPSFGLPHRQPLYSLPAFLPPAELLQIQLLQIQLLHSQPDSPPAMIVDVDPESAALQDQWRRSTRSSSVTAAVTLALLAVLSIATIWWLRTHGVG